MIRGFISLGNVQEIADAVSVSDSSAQHALLRHGARFFLSWPVWETVTRDSIRPRNQDRASCEYIKTLRCDARASYCSSFGRDNLSVVRLHLSAGELKLLEQSLCTVERCYLWSSYRVSVEGDCGKL
jgi:hypothetical protein